MIHPVYFLHKSSMDGTEHMTIQMVNQLKQFSIVRGSKIKAMTFLSHKAIPDTISTF